MALTGRVSRWFNRKGYGFINVVNSDSEHCGNDIFVHLSGINVSEDSYKCLYPGEYVNFDLDTNDGKPVCANVTGVLGGPLLVEHQDYRFKYFSKVNRNLENREVNESVETQETGVSEGVDDSVETTGDQ